MENKPSWAFLNKCSNNAADNINSFQELLFSNSFFNKLFWIIASNQPRLKRIIHNYRRHQFPKRLFKKM